MFIEMCALSILGLVLMFALETGANADGPSLPGVSEKMQEYIEKKEIAGAVTLVASKEKILHLSAVGQADISAETPLRTDAVFWIASMTKPVTGAAVMALVDDRKLSIEDPISKYIPEFGALKLPEGQPANITIRHLLTHTSGMGEMTGEQARTALKLADTIPFFAAQPLHFAPGSKWEYCQSGINTAARIVEIVSGMSFPDFVTKRLFHPLRMTETTFYPSRALVKRLAKSYTRNEDGSLQEAALYFLQGRSPVSIERYPLANGGLFSTASDYARFCQMLLNHGSYYGKQVLSPEAVALMTSVQSGSVTTGFTPGNGWGLGVCVVREPQGVSAMLSPGSFGHGGAYGTQAWIDPVRGLAYILMVQRANFPNSDASDVRRDFQQTASDAAAVKRSR